MKKMKLAVFAAACVLLVSVLAGCSAPSSSAASAFSASSVFQSNTSEPDSVPEEAESSSVPEETPAADSTVSQVIEEEPAVKVTGLRLSAYTKTLKPGQSGTLSVYTSPREAAAPEADGLACTSNNEAVVTALVSGEGRVSLKAVAVGSAEVTVTYQGFSTVCRVTVTAEVSAPAATTTQAPVVQPSEPQGSSDHSVSETPAATPTPETPASTPVPEAPAPTPAPETPVSTPVPTPAGTCPVDHATLLSDGSCALAGLHWMYQDPTNGYGFSEELIQAWRDACNATDAPLNIIIPGGGTMGYTCEQCGGDIVIKAQGPVLGCENGCW